MTRISFAVIGVRGEARGMPHSTVDPPFDQFLATAEAVAQAEAPGDLHDPEAVSAAYLVSASILQL
jgi:hypothetical protein